MEWKLIKQLIKVIFLAKFLLITLLHNSPHPYRSASYLYAL